MQRVNERRTRGGSSQGKPCVRQPFEKEVPARQFKHSRNRHSEMDSLCLKCGTMVASAKDEWSLLEYERNHACNGIRV